MINIPSQESNKSSEENLLIKIFFRNSIGHDITALAFSLLRIIDALNNATIILNDNPDAYYHLNVYFGYIEDLITKGEDTFGVPDIDALDAHMVLKYIAANWKKVARSVYVYRYLYVLCANSSIKFTKAQRENLFDAICDVLLWSEDDRAKIPF